MCNEKLVKTFHNSIGSHQINSHDDDDGGGGDAAINTK